MDKTNIMKVVSLSVLFFMMTLWSSKMPAWAKSPWQWQMTMQGEDNIGRMISPTALFVDGKKERYYVVDSGNNRLLSFDRKGAFIHQFNAGGALTLPYDMARDDKGVLWVVEKEDSRLTEINLKTKDTSHHTLLFNGKKLYPDRLEYSQESIYILDKASGSVFRLNGEGTVKEQIICKDSKAGFDDFKIKEEGIWGLSSNEKTLFLINQSGTLLKKVNIGTQVGFPVSFDFGPSGYIYVLDRHAGEISVFDSSGTYKYSFMQFGRARGRLYYPKEIKFDPWGNLCVVDEGNNRIEIFQR